MEEKIKKILINSLGISENEFTSGISMQNNVAWDSLSQLKIIVDLEEVFDIKFTDNEMIKLTSYLNILNTIRNKSAHKNSR
jgi:acyl carrier protein